MPPRGYGPGANPVRINKGTATARTVEDVCAIKFVKVFYTSLLRSKLLEQGFLTRGPGTS